MKHIEKQMMTDLMGGSMEEMMLMAMMMEGGMDLGPDIDDFQEFEKMMKGKSGKGKKGPDLTAAEAAMMQELFGKGTQETKNKKTTKKSDEEWETDSEEDVPEKKKNNVDDDDGWETDSN